MRTAVVAIVCLSIGVALADDAAQAIAKQKASIEQAWKTMQLKPEIPLEGANLLVTGQLPEAKIKSLAANLEKQFQTAFKALQFDMGDSALTGKLSVFVLPDRSQYRSFIRSVIKESPGDEEQGRANLKGDFPMIVVGPGRAKDSPTPEVQAGYEINMALLAARTKNAPLPEWCSVGFARATAMQANGTTGGVRKKPARDLIARRVRLKDLWSDSLNEEQKLALGTSVIDFSFYGKGLPKPIDFLLAMRPEEDKTMKSAEDIFAAIKMKPEQFEVAFLKWLRAP